MSSPDRGPLAVTGCCVVAAVGYAGSVRVPALLTYVLPTAAVVGVVAGQLGRRVGVVSGAALAALLALLLAQLANTTGGETSGPVARSTFLAGLFTAVAAAGARVTSPPVVALPVMLVLAGALYLGAAGEVLPVLVATAVLLVLTLPLLESARRRADRSVRRRWLTPVLAAAVGASALAAAQLQAQRGPGPPRGLAEAQIDRTVIPPRLLGAGSVPQEAAAQPRPARTSVPQSRSAPVPAPPGRQVAPGPLLVIGLLLGLALALLVRVALVALGWRRLRRRLRRGAAGHPVAGAWVWAVLRLRSYGVPVPASTSPDRYAAGDSPTTVSDSVDRPLQDVAVWAVRATFQPQPGLPTASTGQAWTAAASAVSQRRRELHRARRAMVALRRPPRLPGSSGVDGRTRSGADWPDLRPRRPRLP